MQPVLADRLMYGSDWHMISQESNWDDYASDLLAATKDIIRPEKFFGGNAMVCFGAGATPPSVEGSGSILQ